MGIVKPYLGMVFLQLGYAGMACSSSPSRTGTPSLLPSSPPSALWFEGKVRPKMTLPIFLKIMASAPPEPVLDQNFYHTGAKHTICKLSPLHSATYCLQSSHLRKRHRVKVKVRIPVVFTH
ncbi:hypothetical protein OPV22_023171 [Ensete ventricosum]|uniref:Secreted protein n=1 Tax=Ensete ventricosum TaxID=4639 RepID=A0AAV8QRC3_ENSVE|nr:hypothetical protein OPV22_023171 [Ensete ventricosum]